MNRASGADQPVPQGDYVAATRFGAVVQTAGMTPSKMGVLQFTGPVRRDAMDAARQAARLACANAVRAAQGTLTGDETISAVLSMTVYMVTEADFADHSRVADFASQFLHEELGKAGTCARAAIGVQSLPGGASIEIQICAAIA